MAGVAPLFSPGGAAPFGNESFGRQQMIILIAILGYLILGGVVVYLLKRLSRAKGELFAARRQAVHARANFDAAKNAARLAEKRCVQALQNVQMSLTQAGKAMEVAGHIHVVSEQIHFLTEAITGPLEEGPSGRHALPGTGLPAIVGTEEAEYPEYDQEEYAS